MFSYSPIDRQGPLRADETHINDLWKNHSSQTLMWCDGKFIMGKDVPRFFSYAELSSITEELSGPVYLGTHQNNHYFACHINAKQKLPPNHESVTLRQASRVVQGFHLGLLFHAQGILNWLKNHAYCSHCGAHTRIIQSGHARQCLSSECAKIHYPKIDPAVIFSIINNTGAESRILLGRQKHWDQNRYSVVAGFVEPGEMLEDAVRREALEETGLVVENVHYFSSQSWPFPDSLMLGFYAESKQSEIRLVDQELETARWFTAAQIESELKQEKLKMPNEVSISWHLINRWFTQQTGHSISQIE